VTLKHLVLALVALLTCLAAGAQTRVLIVREDAPVSRQTSEILAREFARLGWPAGEAVVGFERPTPELRRDGEQILVALGSRALVAATKQAAGRAVVGALVSRPALDEMMPIGADRWTVILLDQPLDRWVNLLQIAFPGRNQVGLLLGPAGQKTVRMLERKFQERRLALATEAIASSEEVVPALERLLPRMGLLLALPDTLAHNRNTVQPLLLTTYRAGVPVVAYSESYQQAGATVALYSTPPQIAYQVVESVQQFADGKLPQNIQMPRYYTVGVNTAVARSLGLQIAPVSDIQDQLRSLDQ
jgi:ABC-type uncharacterized transport system substrate-binding protein